MRKYLLYGAHLYALSILRPLQQAIRERGDDAAWFFIADMARQQDDYMRPDEKILDSVEAVKAYQPEAVFATTNTVPDFFPGLKVQLFHGFNSRKRSERKGHFRIRGFFDLYCTQGPDTTEQFHELAKQHGYFDVIETGWSKMDPLFAPGDDSTLSLPDDDRPVVFLASTFTPRLSAAHRIPDRIESLIATGRWRWLCNLHPKMDAEIVDRFRRIDGDHDHFRLIETDNIIPLLRKADVMLADTSSIISEFLLQHKPIVTYDNQSPAPHLINVTNPDDLESAIEQALNPHDSLKQAIESCASRIHPYTDGKSCSRILKAVDECISRGVKHLKSKPLNLLRRLKMRKTLGYYRWN